MSGTTELVLGAVLALALVAIVLELLVHRRHRRRGEELRRQYVDNLVDYHRRKRILLDYGHILDDAAELIHRYHRAGSVSVLANERAEELASNLRRMRACVLSDKTPDPMAERAEAFEDVTRMLVEMLDTEVKPTPDQRARIRRMLQ